MAKAARVIGKVDLVGNVAQITELTKENAKKATNAVLEGMLTLLEQSGKLRLVNFGSFSVKHMKERPGRNPQTGKPITIPAGVRIGFKVSKTWKEAMMAREQEQLKLFFYSKSGVHCCNPLKRLNRSLRNPDFLKNVVPQNGMFILDI